MMIYFGKKELFFMKSTQKMYAFLLAALMLFALVSCGGDGKKKEEEVIKTVADDTAVLGMSFSAPETYETVQRDIEKDTQGKLMNKSISYKIAENSYLSFAFTIAEGRKLEDELGEMKVERKEYNGVELIIYKSSKKTYMAFYQVGDNVYGVQYRALNEETIDDEFDKILQTVKMTDATETTVNDITLDNIQYDLATDVPLYSESTSVVEKPDGTLVKKSFVWKYSEDSEKISYRFGIEQNKNTKLEDLISADKEYAEKKIGNVTYTFEKGEKKTDTYDHYNYYVQQGEDVYVVQNKGVSNGWVVSRSEESKKAFKKFINAVQFE